MRKHPALIVDGESLFNLTQSTGSMEKFYTSASLMQTTTLLLWQEKKRFF
jgi:hypothetical protein